MSNVYLSERMLRMADSQSFCQYGIGYLDDCLGFIRPPELVILAALTGSGKTELLASIAATNAVLGRRVTLFGLEAEAFEIERRAKYKLIAKKFFAERHRYPEALNLNFTDWLNCVYGDKLDHLEEEAEKEMPAIMENVAVYSPDIARFTKRDFTMVYEEYCKDSNLILLDHIHYIAPQEREHEHDNIQKIMWDIRTLINKHRVPIIAASHIRKEDKRDSTLLPTLSDLHGSSEITKQANHVISFAPLRELPKKDNYKEKFTLPIGMTLCKILKTRTGHDGAITYAGALRFDLKMREYDTRYVPYKINQQCSTLFPMKYSDFEYWMGNAAEAKS